MNPNPVDIKELLLHAYPHLSVAVDALRVDEDVAKIVTQSLDSIRSDRVRQALYLRYGLNEPKLSLEEVGVRLGKVRQTGLPASRERARQIVAKGLRMMRHPTRSSRIIGLLEAISSTLPPTRCYGYFIQHHYAKRHPDDWREPTHLGYTVWWLDTEMKEHTARFGKGVCPTRFEVVPMHNHKRLEVLGVGDFIIHQS